MDVRNKLLTYRQWLTYQALLAGAEWPTVHEAVASTAIEHPEWDMDETHTWDEWEKGKY